RTSGASDQGWARLSVTLDAGPATDRSEQRVTDLRDAVRGVPGYDALVGGAVDEAVDSNEGNLRELSLNGPQILLVVLLVLVLVLRAVVAPLLIMLATILSSLGALGLGTFVTTRILDFPGLDVAVPLYSFLFLVALGVDYSIFLTIRAREEAATLPTRDAMLRAVALTGGVITSAGIVLASVFVVLGVLPLVVLTQVGVIVALGVLLDTFVVRTLVVPALFTLVADRVWWPGGPRRAPARSPSVDRAGAEKPEGGTVSIELEHTIGVDPATAWGYFAAPGAMCRLAPPFMPLRPLREADSLRDGVAVLVPRSALPGPLGARLGPAWTATHDPAAYVDGERFVDRCTSQPYAGLTGWVHEHTVTAGPDGTTVLGDRVDARVPARLLEPMFAYRHRQMERDLERFRELEGLGDGRPRTVAVSGASGLVGEALVALLGVAGHRVIRLVRRPARAADERHWDPEPPSTDLLDAADTRVHRAGASIAGRCTDRHLDRVRDSRVGPTRRLAELVAARGGRTALVCASAVGVYGPDRGDEELDEH